MVDPWAIRRQGFRFFGAEQGAVLLKVSRELREVRRGLRPESLSNVVGVLAANIRDVNLEDGVSWVVKLFLELLNAEGLDI